MKTFDPDQPLVLGLAGGYATGKTVTANGLAPTARISFRQEEGSNGPSIFWDHFYFALPLYRMATARQNIEGEQSFDRIAYEIHETLVDVFGGNPIYGAPSYRELVSMVEKIVSYPCPREGKPRSFLQYVGTEICRAYDADCWVKWMDRKIKTEHRTFVLENTNEEGDLDSLYGAVISDCRFPNEAKFIVDQPNGILLKFTASPDVVEQRQFDRDGFSMDSTQKSHASETSLDGIPDEWFTEIIDTSEMTIEDQINHVKDIVTNFTGVTTYA